MADLFLSSKYDNDRIIQLLGNARDEANYSSLTFCETNFGLRVCKALLDLVSCDNREWTQIVIQNCTCLTKSIFDFVAAAVAKNFQTVKLCGKYQFENHLVPELICQLDSRQCRVREISLQGFRFAWNDVPDFERGFSQNTSLERLTLQDVSFACQSDAESLTTGLGLNETLNELSLQRLSHSLVVEIVQALGSSYSRSRIQTLMISNTSMSHSCLRDFAMALRKTSSLRELELSNNKLSDESVYILATALQQSSSLESLNFSCNGIGDVGASSLSRTSSNSQVHTLSLRRNRITAEGFRRLTSSSLAKSSLRCLDLSSNSFMGSWGALPKDSLHGLQTLDLSNGGLGDEGLKSLSVALEHSQLEQLCLSENHIGDQGMAHLANSKTSALKNLDLSENQVGDAGFAILAASFANHPHLQLLNMMGNQIGNLGMARFCVALQLPIVASSLRHANLSGNEINDEAIIDLVECLKGNSSLIRLDISLNPLVDEAAAGDLLTRAFEINTSLEQLDFRSRDDDNGGYTELEYYMSLNRGGRKLFRSKEFHRALWPRILERTDRVGRGDDPHSTTSGADLIYHFLQQGGEHRIL
jgi:Ran GTPase-activating protein (RanGAP) involved in mRNA processing and transport